MWEGLNFKSYFDDILASCFIGYEKPQADYYQKVQEKIGVPSHQILFLDDHLKNVEAAKKEGWEAFQHKNYEETKEAIFQHLW